jgi:hypothetical protein
MMPAMAQTDDNGSGGAAGGGAAMGMAGGAGINYRRIFEHDLRPLPPDARMAAAREAEGALLSALCLDPDPRVIIRVLENALTGLSQARLIAEHHQNPVGLEALSARSAFLQDEAVRRLLLRNVQTPESVLRKLFLSSNLLQLFKLSVSRENTERAKRAARDALRRRFLQVGGEECAALIFTTEGRCLALLLGLQFDGKTTALLCRRTYASTLLIQNLARFPGTPPPVIRHLLNQPMVRRTPHLRQLLLQHANCPSESKRTN